MESKEKAMRIVGVDIGGTSIKLGVFNEKGQEEQIIEYDTNSERGGNYVLDTIIENVATLGDIDAIGISSAGQIDNKRGIIGGSVNIPGATDLRVKEILEAQFQVPVSVENDVNAAALGENHFGVGKDLDDFLFIAYGTGIGGAIIQDGKVAYGRDGYSGEFGHMMTHAGGRRCNCGLYGCYEKYGSTKALVADAKRVSSAYINGKVIFDAYHDGDEMIQAIVHNWLDEVAAGLISLVHIFNPSTLVIGGGVMEQELLMEEISKRVNQQILPPFREVKIVSTTLGNKAGMLGAISLHV